MKWRGHCFFIYLEICIEKGESCYLPVILILMYTLPLLKSDSVQYQVFKSPRTDTFPWAQKWHSPLEADPVPSATFSYFLCIYKIMFFLFVCFIVVVFLFCFFCFFYKLLLFVFVLWLFANVDDTESRVRQDCCQKVFGGHLLLFVVVSSGKSLFFL